MKYSDEFGRPLRCVLVRSCEMEKDYDACDIHLPSNTDKLRKLEICLLSNQLETNMGCYLCAIQ